jgi:hypothetical protein
VTSTRAKTATMENQKRGMSLLSSVSQLCTSAELCRFEIYRARSQLQRLSRSERMST